MLKAVKGTFKNGKIKLAETPANISEDSEVIVTFLSEKTQDERKPMDLHGLWKTEGAEEIDVIAEIREIRDAWKEELEKFGDAA